MKRMIIRRMSGSDVDFAFECTSAEGWQSKKEAFEGFLAHDPAGCFVGELDGRPIGICVGTKYGSNGFIGNLIVVKDMRGQGYGGRLFRHAIRYLQSNGVDSVFLDGASDAVPIYEKAGFRRICKSLRFVGRVEGRESGLVRRAEPGDAEAICKIDLEPFGDDRSFFLKRRLSVSPHLCYVYEANGQVLGYIMARPGVSAFSVGPWAAVKGAEEPGALLERLALEVGGGPLRVGVLEVNQRAVDTVESFGSLASKLPSWRMVLGPSERLGMSGELYAIGSPAKG
jgi:ribosomal protein S18 acetylase RimI-like enzyme